jgi:hypothetical protein
VQGTPSCVTVKVCPATVTVPVREDVVVLAAMVSETVPFPFPDPFPLTVIQAALLAAVHTHPLPAVTDTVTLSPLAGALQLAGESE